MMNHGINLAVTKVLGLQVDGDGFVICEPPDWYQGEIKNSSMPAWVFRPADDLNAAMWAAERAELFDGSHYLGRGESKPWAVYSNEDDGVVLRLIEVGAADSPARAIAIAIVNENVRR